MSELIEVSGLANDESCEPQAQKQVAQAQHSRKNHHRPAQGLRTADRQRAGCRREQRQVGNRGREAQLKQSLGPPEVARLANAQLHQACYAVLHHLASPSCVIKRRTGLQLARLLEQGFLWMELHRASAFPPRALGSQWARRTGLGGKDEQPTSTLRGSQVTGRVFVGASARPSLQIDLKDGLGEELLVVDLGNLGDHRPSTRREFRSRVARSIGTVANHLY